MAQSYPKYVPVKLGLYILAFNLYSLFFSSFVALPEQSTDVGDLIQPAPGVLYEDSKVKKGDPRRYKVSCQLVLSMNVSIFNRTACQNIRISMMKVAH
jgi:hypothetical protein